MTQESFQNREDHPSNISHDRCLSKRFLLFKMKFQILEPFRGLEDLNIPSLLSKSRSFDCNILTHLDEDVHKISMLASLQEPIFATSSS